MFLARGENVNDCSVYWKDGCLAIPVTEESTVSKINSIAEMVGAQFTWIPLSDCEEASNVSLKPEVVVALGESASLAAEFYAQATRRHFTIVARTEELDNVPNTAVVVTSYDYWSQSLTRTNFASVGEDWNPGFILGDDDSSALLEAAKVFAATMAMSWKSRAACKSGYVFQAVESGLSEFDDGFLAGNKAPIDKLLDLIANSNLDYLQIATHGDGFDSPFVDGTIICPFRLSRFENHRARRPACLVTGLCHRSAYTPIDQMWRENKLIGPECLAARILVYDSCYGMPYSDGLIPPEVGLGQELLRKSTFGCLVLNVGLTISNNILSYAILTSFQSNDTVGEAVANFNRSETARKYNKRLLLFGDPSFPSLKQTA